MENLDGDENSAPEPSSSLLLKQLSMIRRFSSSNRSARLLPADDITFARATAYGYRGEGRGGGAEARERSCDLMSRESRGTSSRLMMSQLS